ncbi:hypothetical protein [Lacihabitans soyangensis]|uniref:Uncharacterized protein n=1 Tax=Lacihabitans soyangensis TaxID=869394 RepID=A0AAE3KWN3_9BACT|nr:hypothetical protein [Lacihabitans soyangensis]MCP9763180.1 hypothetical protein [Lacihabitans soyangensis]
MFDKTKYLKKAGNTEATFVADMKRAIDGLTFSNTQAAKFINDIPNPSGSDLKDFIKANFSSIFELK